MNRNVRRGSFALGAIVVVVALLAGCVSSYQTNVFNLLNKVRAQNGKSAFVLDEQLMDKAQAWAQHLADTGTLSHSSPTSGVTGCYKSLGENVGDGTNITAVVNAWMADAGINPPIHRNNILSSSYNHAGTGVVVKNGVYWVVFEFKTAC